MLPFGGHKGSAIGTMIELLAGVMIGDLTSLEMLEQLGTTTLAPHPGELVIALSPEAFGKGALRATDALTPSQKAWAELQLDQFRSWYAGWNALPGVVQSCRA